MAPATRGVPLRAPPTRVIFRHHLATSRNYWWCVVSPVVGYPEVVIRSRWHHARVGSWL